MVNHTNYIDQIITKIKRKNSIEWRDAEITKLQNELDEAIRQKELWRSKYHTLKSEKLNAQT